MTPPAEYAPRLDGLRAILSAQDCAAMLVDHAELLAWITGYTVSQTMYRAALVPRDGAPCFVLRDLDAAPCRAAVWFPDVVAFPDWADPYESVAREIRSRELAQSRIGADFASYGFTAATQRRLTALLPDATFVDLGPVSDTLRAAKSDAEIALLRRASAIADATMQVLADSVVPGMRVRDAAAIAAGEFLRRGADDGGPGPILRTTGDIDFLHGQGLDATLTERDILHVELTPRVGNYGARLMRPIMVAPDPERLRLARRLIDLQNAQFAAMRPGVSARDVDAVLRTSILAERLRASYPNVTGYSLGLYARTPRPSDFSLSFHPNADFTLEAGMVFHMYVSAQGLAFSESVLITQDLPMRLTRFPRTPIFSVKC